MRHRVSWLDSVGLFIADEVHLAGSDSRGPTLEMILTKVMHLGLDSQLLSLSATISNAGEVSKWLNSKLVELSWRPVPLREGVYDYGRILFTDGEERPVTRSTYGADRRRNRHSEDGRSISHLCRNKAEGGQPRDEGGGDHPTVLGREGEGALQRGREEDKKRGGGDEPQQPPRRPGVDGVRISSCGAGERAPTNSRGLLQSEGD